MMDTGLNTLTEDLKQWPNQTGTKQTTVATVTVTTTATVTEGETSPALRSQKFIISGFSDAFDITVKRKMASSLRTQHETQSGVYTFSSRPRAVPNRPQYRVQAAPLL